MEAVLFWNFVETNALININMYSKKVSVKTMKIKKVSKKTKLLNLFSIKMHILFVLFYIDFSIIYLLLLFLDK